MNPPNRQPRREAAEETGLGELPAGVTALIAAAHLRDPHTHTVAYAIPSGVDPVTAESALARAGFTSGIDRVGMVECILIECDESQRDRARKVLEGISMTAYDGSPLPAGQVVFEDAR